MKNYEQFGFISGCIYYATAISVVVSVSVLNTGLTFTEVLLLCIFLLMLISKGQDTINASESDDDE